MESHLTAHEPPRGPSIREYIVATPGTCGGKPRIDGTRIRVQDIYVWHELQGQSAEDILTCFPHLTLAGIYAALAYFWDHRDAILRNIADDDDCIAAFQHDHPEQIIVTPPLPHVGPDMLPPR